MEMDEKKTGLMETQEEAPVATATTADVTPHPAGKFVWSAAFGALTIWPWGAILMTLPHRKALAAQKMEWKYCGHMVLVTIFTWFGMIGSKHWILDKLYKHQSFEWAMAQRTGDYSNLTLTVDTFSAILYQWLYYAICIALFIFIGRHAAKHLAKVTPNYPKEIYRKKEWVGIIVNAVIWLLVNLPPILENAVS